MNRVEPIPEPALIVLVGAAGAGKSSWAAERYRRAEVVSSDALREVLGSGPADLDASAEAFALLERILAARTSRGLTAVVDTLGLDRRRRLGHLALARTAGLPAVLVVFDTPGRVCRARNAERARPVPARVLTEQLRSLAALEPEAEGWDTIIRVEGSEPTAEAGTRIEPERRGRRDGLQLILQVSRFPWGEESGRWLRELARGAAEVGLDGLALMDHLIQIPQVARAWDPIPEPWVSLGFLAGLDLDLRLGTLVSPVTFRAPGLIAKTAATLDALSTGPTFCGLGAGWWEREHAAYGLEFPPAAQRLDQLETCIETVRALWAPGTKPYAGRRVSLPETTCYPRPERRIPVIVGGSGHRTLRIVADQADGCNLPSDEVRLTERLTVLQQHCHRTGRDIAELEVTVLDVPVIGRDREDTARRVERLRGGSSAATYARRHPVGEARLHADRYLRLADRGVSTVFCALPDLDRASDLEHLGPVIDALR